MNNKCCRFKGKMVTLTIAFLLSLLLCKGALAGNWERNPDLTIGWTAWSDAEVISKMAVIILSRAMNYDVELTLADISVQYRGVAEGDLDAMLMSWQPRTHAEYLERYKDQLVDLGPLYENTTLGLVVPDYMAESGVNSIADLAKPAVKNRFQGKIQGIGATAGLMKLSRQALDAYQLDYTLVTSSGPAMAKRLGEALQNQSPIVATGWRPHSDSCHRMAAPLDFCRIPDPISPRPQRHL